jgi:hypothetical protein
MQQSNNAKISNLSAQSSADRATPIDWGNESQSERKPPHLRNFSTAENIYASPGGSITLQAFIEGIRGGRWREPVQAVRSALLADRSSFKNRLFTVYPSVLMRGNKSASNIDEYTGILVVDVDAKGNAPDLLDWAPESLRRDQYTLAFHRSCGGSGLAIYYLVDSTQTEHAAAYRELSARLYQFHSIIADPACTNANRGVRISYDPDAYINADAESYGVPDQPADVGRVVRDVAALCDGEGHSIAVAAISAGVDLTQTEHDWFRLGKWVAQQYGDDGRELFHQLSQFHPKYNTRETDNKFTMLVRGLNTSTSRVSDNMPRILAHIYAPQLLDQLKAQSATKTSNNRYKTGEITHSESAAQPVTNTDNNRRETGENIDRTSVRAPVSLAIGLSEKEAHRATTVGQTAYTSTASPIVPQNARNRAKTTEELDRLLAATRYNHNPSYMPPQSVISINGERFATPGNFSVLVGLQKSGKGFVLSAIAAAYLRGEGGQCLSFKASPITGKPDVVIIDTEQDESDLNITTERLRRAVTDEQFARVTVYSWRVQAPTDALELLPRITAVHPSAGLVIIDGIADLSPSGVNDDVGARDVAHRLKALTTSTGVHIVTVIHLNKGAGNNDKASEFSQIASTQVAGHLGINLQRKAETTIGVHKDKERRLHSVHPVNSRGRDFAPFAFTISRAIDMPEHVTAVQYEAIKASEVVSPSKELAASIAVSVHSEIVAEVFSIAPELNTTDLLAHIARVVSRRKGSKVSDRYARSFHAEWQSHKLIEATQSPRHPRQTWRALIPTASTEPVQTKQPTPAAPAELFAPDPSDKARAAAISKRKRQPKKGGK